jgi:hypothetical protein
MCCYGVWVLIDFSTYIISQPNFGCKPMIKVVTIYAFLSSCVHHVVHQI